MDERLKPFAEAVGELCQEWAHLELTLTRLFLSIGGWDYRLPAVLEMSECLDFRDKLRAAKMGATVKLRNGALLEAIISSLDYIDNQIRTARNRFVHDIWAPAEDGLGAMKINMSPRSSKEPASGDRLVQSWNMAYVDLDEIHEVITDILAERQCLSEILNCFQTCSFDLPGLLSTPPQRLHLLRLKEMQRQRHTSREEQTPPPPPSPP